MIYDDRTRSKVIFLYPAFALSLLDVYDDMYKQTGKSMSLVEGLRTFGEQQDVYAQGRTKPGKIITNAQPGQSTHNFALGADNCFRDGDGYSNEPWILFSQLAVEHGLENGDVWRKLCDKDHVQCTYGMELSDLLLTWKSGGNTAVFGKLDAVRGVSVDENWQNTLLRLRSRLVS